MFPKALECVMYTYLEYSKSFSLVCVLCFMQKKGILNNT